jgi:hypothetical protein
MTDAASGEIQAAEASSQASSEPAKPAPANAGVVAFEHRFFNSFPDLFFYLPEFGGDPVAVVKLGEQEVSLSFKGLRVEFNIAADSPDGQMLTLVEEGLGFVNGLRIGDPIPKEVLTHEASWEPSAEHYQIAFNRLTLQLSTWMSGKETIITDPQELMQLAEDPQTKQKVNAAFEEAAEMLGIGREKKADVVGRIETLAKELAYIEALREKLHQMIAMQQKIEKLRRLYSMERSVLDIIDRVARLANNAVGKFKVKFEAIDKATANILEVLETLDKKIEGIRASRDDLHRSLIAWTEVLAAWNACRTEISEENEDLLHETYRFLAPRYLPVSEWVLVTKVAARKPGEEKKLKTRVFVRGAKPAKSLRRW